MAKVELVKQEAKAPEWVPFVTLTLSKREAAGLLKEAGPYPSYCSGWQLFNELDKFLKQDLIDSPSIHFSDVYNTAESVGKYLDKKFGPV